MKINEANVQVASNGDFSYEVNLPAEQNQITVSAKNKSSSTAEVKLAVSRVFTEEEKAEAEAQKQAAVEAAKKAEEELKAKELAEQKAWEQSKAGKICTKHPEWSKEDCQKLADNKIWIGMTIDMLKYQRGLPNSSNPSNYGSGTKWQWCWYDYTPSCFYGSDDGVIDSYN